MTFDNILMIIPSWSPEDAVLAEVSAKSFSMNDLTRIATFAPAEGGGRYLFTTTSAGESGRYHHICEEMRYLLPVEAMRTAAEIAMDGGPELVNARTLLVFMHDDVTLSPGWDTALLDLFNRQPACGLAGFGGALGFADPDIYRRPYALRQLGRVDFRSNMQEAETHGSRYTGSPLQVAALDGFLLAIPSTVYTAIGDWQACLDARIPFHMYDAWLSLTVQLLGHRAEAGGRNQVWMTPVWCHHAGGRTSVTKAGIYNQQMTRLGFQSAQELFDRAHEIIYEEFRGMLPIGVADAGRTVAAEGDPADETTE